MEYAHVLMLSFKHFFRFGEGWKREKNSGKGKVKRFRVMNWQQYSYYFRRVFFCHGYCQCRASAKHRKHWVAALPNRSKQQESEQTVKTIQKPFSQTKLWSFPLFFRIKCTDEDMAHILYHAPKFCSVSHPKMKVWTKHEKNNEHTMSSQCKFGRRMCVQCTTLALQKA